MTLQEVLKSGKRFKRKDAHNYFCSFVGVDDYGRSLAYFSASDVLADDWIIEDKIITISESEYLFLIAEVLGELAASRGQFQFYDAHAIESGMINLMMKKLFGEL
jgi:hypothetical protein